MYFLKAMTDSFQILNEGKTNFRGGGGGGGVLGLTNKQDFPQTMLGSFLMLFKETEHMGVEIRQGPRLTLVSW